MNRYLLGKSPNLGQMQRLQRHYQAQLATCKTEDARNVVRLHLRKIEQQIDCLLKAEANP